MYCKKVYLRNIYIQCVVVAACDNRIDTTHNSWRADNMCEKCNFISIIIMLVNVE